MAYFDDLRTYRERAGLRASKVAAAAELDRNTVSRAERHQNCQRVTLVRMVHALNDLYYAQRGSPLDPEKLITEKSRFGHTAPGTRTPAPDTLDGDAA